MTSGTLPSSVPRQLQPYAFKPGNVAWRKPTEATLLSCIKDELAVLLPVGRTRQQSIAKTLVNLAEDGDLRAIELVLAYVTPKPKLFEGAQSVEITVKWEDGHSAQLDSQATEVVELQGDRDKLQAATEVQRERP